MRGIILSGGTGSRLWPITTSISKQLLPVFNKPLIYYPIATLMQHGIQEILIITTEDDLHLYKKLLGDGRAFGIELQYLTQSKPEGIAQSITIGSSFINNANFALILGDNFFHGLNPNFVNDYDLSNMGASIFGIEVANPSHYGVAELKSDGSVESIIEKPKHSKSGLAIPGLYFFDKNATEWVLELKKSPRGELEITDLLSMYLKHGNLQLIKLGQETAWFDCGTPSSLNEASNFVRALEDRSASMVACLEQIALTRNWISEREIIQRTKEIGQNEYSEYLKKIISSTP
jgi:glucose-1-phosphate thymidylyltransferase